MTMTNLRDLTSYFKMPNGRGDQPHWLACATTLGGQVRLNPARWQTFDSSSGIRQKSGVNLRLDYGGPAGISSDYLATK
jgi:hypothetical protein